MRVVHSLLRFLCMMENKQLILLVEDDKDLGFLLSEYLRMKDLEVVWVTSGNVALEEIEGRRFALAVLDVMMPGMDGFTLASRIREKDERLPFLFLTARSLKTDVLKGLQLGAVEYIKKPVDEEELVMRIKALLKWIPGQREVISNHVYRLGRYRFDVREQLLSLESSQIRLTGRESEVLQVLCEHANRLCSHKELLTRIWGRNDYFNRKSLNVFITKLRKYLELDASVTIENVHNEGFVLHLPPEAS